MAVTNTNANMTPGEKQDGETVPSNLDAARPVLDRIKDIDEARDGNMGVSGGDNVVDNSPETAAEEVKAEEDAKAAEKDEKVASKSKRTAKD